MSCNSPWIKVDHVLFSINIEAEEHFILGRLSFADRFIYVYNSMSSKTNVNSATKVVSVYSILLPRFLMMLSFLGVAKISTLKLVLMKAKL